ncbi:LOW QUALITY PROTEIN: hypothetical protein YC2023_036329 [Brassica napus]
MKEMKRSDRFSRDDTEEFIEAWIHGRIPEWCRKPKKKRQRRKKDCRRKRKSVEEDWSSPSSRILSSSPSILANVVLVSKKVDKADELDGGGDNKTVVWLEDVGALVTAVKKEEDNNDLPALVIWKKHAVV